MNKPRKEDKTMKNVQRDAMFDYFINGLDSKMQATLNMMYMNSMRIDEMNHRREMEQMKKEIIEEVLSRISIMFETGEAIKEINALNKAIEQLGR